MSDPFTRDKLRWLDQVAADPGVADGAFRLAYHLASRYINRKTGDSFCGQERLATDLGTTSRNIRKLLDQLVSREHLLIAKARGRGHINRCRWNIKNRNDPSSFNEENRNDPSSFSDRKQEQTRPKNRNNSVHKTGTKVPGTPFEESPLANPLERRRDADSDKRAGKTTTKGRSKSVNALNVDQVIRACEDAACLYGRPAGFDYNIDGILDLLNDGCDLERHVLPTLYKLQREVRQAGSYAFSFPAIRAAKERTP
jgi:hypothetical protein